VKCLYCKGDTRVTESGVMPTKVVRRRKCLSCGKFFLTEEKGTLESSELERELYKFRKLRRLMK